MTFKELFQEGSELHKRIKRLVFWHKLGQHIDIALLVVLLPDERTEEAEPFHPELPDLVCMVL